MQWLLAAWAFAVGLGLGLAIRRDSYGGNDSPHTPPNSKPSRGPGGNHSPQKETIS